MIIVCSNFLNFNIISSAVVPPHSRTVPILRVHRETFSSLSQCKSWVESMELKHIKASAFSSPEILKCLAREVGVCHISNSSLHITSYSEKLSHFSYTPFSYTAQKYYTISISIVIQSDAYVSNITPVIFYLCHSCFLTRRYFMLSQFYCAMHTLIGCRSTRCR